jgi:tetratricopeptide (TPR) repeat protein
MKQKNPSNNPASKINSSETHNRVFRILGFFVFGIALLIYLNTLNHSYVLDDFSTIKDNRVTTQGPKAIGDIFSHYYRYGYYTSDDGLYRPLPVAIFAIEWWLAPNNPSLAHFVNIMLYALTGWLLFMTLKKLMKNYNVILPFIVTLLFIAHPIHTEVVANIKSLDELLGFLFSFSAIFFLCDYFEKKSIRTLAIGIFFFFLALLSKESAITMLVGIPLCFLYFKKEKRNEIIISTIGLFLMAALFLLIRAYFLSKSTSTEPTDALLNPLLSAKDALHQFSNAMRIMGYYIRLLVFPRPLIYDYSFNQIPLVNSFDPLSILSALFYVGLLTYGIIGFFKRQLLAFGVLFYLLSLIVFSNLFFLLGVSMAERFVYFASLGFSFSVGVLLMKWTKTSFEARTYNNLNSFWIANRKLIFVSSLIVFVYSAGTISRNRDWKDNFTLFSHDVEYMPNNARAHSFLGNEIIKTLAVNENDSAQYIQMNLNGIEALKQSIEIYPKNIDALNCLGTAYQRINRLSEAESSYKQAIALNSTDYSYIANFYMNMRDYDSAIKYYSKIIQINPKQLDALVYLGIANGAKNQFKAAISYLKQAAVIQPEGSQIYYYLSSAYKYSGDSINAEKFYQEAYRLDPTLERP